MTHPFIEHLKKDHETQRQLADKLSAAKTKEEKEHYRHAFADALYPHLEGEDASIFKYLKSKGGEARQGALEAMEEHHVDRVLLRELMKIDVGDEKFTAKAKVLNEINAHHLEEEEEEHFPRLESLAGKEKLDELFEAYELREEEVNENELLMA